MALVCVLVVNLRNGEDTTTCRRPNRPFAESHCRHGFPLSFFVPLTIQFRLGPPNICMSFKFDNLPLIPMSPCLHL